jgi:hypothetical protein
MMNTSKSVTQQSFLEISKAGNGKVFSQRLVLQAVGIVYDDFTAVGDSAALGLGFVFGWDVKGDEMG